MCGFGLLLTLHISDFYPHDAMLMWVLSLTLCPCLCLSVTSQCPFEWLNESCWFLAWQLLSTYPTLAFTAKLPDTLKAKEDYQQQSYTVL